MRVVRISARLLAVASFVVRGSRVADIGTELAALPVYLIQMGRATCVVAVESSRSCYFKAKANVSEAGLEGSIQVRYGNGLQAVHPGEVDTIIIAGLGGLSIQGILLEGRNVWAPAQRLILQPMDRVSSTRRFLYECGWHLAGEDMVRDRRRYYEILCAEPGPRNMPCDLLLEVGPLLMEQKHPLLGAKIRQDIAYWEGVMGRLKGRPDGIFLTVKQKLDRLQEALKIYEQS